MKRFFLVMIMIMLSLAIISCNQIEYEVPDSCDVYSFTDESEFIGYINSYKIIRPSFQVRCECVLGSIIVDGYNFGFFYDGCENNLNWLGYLAEKDQITYRIQELVDTKKISVEQIYHLYMCDPNHLGITN